MQLLKLGCATLIVASVSVGAAETKKPKSPRTVQIITMTSAPAEGATKARLADPDASGEGGAIPPPTASADFRAHDLSRRWVEFNMGENFVSPAAPAALTTSPGAADPFAPVGVAQLGDDRRGGTLLPPPAVAIPDWMRGGLAFAAAATSFVPGCSAGNYRPTGFLAPDAEGRRFGHYAMMSNIACAYGIPVGLFDAMIIRESRYRADIFSPKNAFGLTQLMPGTAAGLGVNRYDVEQNLRGGARYLRQQLDRFGQVHLALAAYNAGPGRVRNGMLPRIAETQAYVDNVLLNWRRLAGFARVASVQNVDRPAARPLPSGRVATISSY